MIAETLYWSVCTQTYWKLLTEKVQTVIVEQPYSYNGCDKLFNGKCIVVLETLGM